MSGPLTAVIGAGISGLTAAKMLGDYGVPYTCFESSDRVGGNWAFGNPNGHSSAYRSLHIDTSKYRLSFRDYPMPDDYPDFPHHSQIFVGPLAARVDADRRAGVAPPGPDSRSLITVLLELNDRAVEQLEHGDPLDAESRLEALVTVWLRTLYGNAADEPLARPANTTDRSAT
jgi:uncharacterized protein with NAD-binding domain and iron-sulfur cluster